MGIKRQIQNLLRRAGYRLTSLRPAVHYPYLDVLDILIQAQMNKGTTPYFVQIGANDGQTMDPLSPFIDRYGMPGLMVEPQPIVFKKLVAHRQHLPELSFENALIGSADGQATLYIPRPDTTLPEWLGQAASMDRLQLFAMLDQYFRTEGKERDSIGVNELIETVQLPCLTMTSLLAKHSVEQVDLLVLDTMGFDCDILKSFPWAQMRPGIVQFEHRLMGREDHIACIDMLAGLGYSLCQIDMDTLGVLNGPQRSGTYISA
jgi:FkbM family methyltransferase